MPSLTRSTIAKFESGVRAHMTVEELDVLARVFGVSVETLVQQDPHMPAETSDRDDLPRWPTAFTPGPFIGRRMEIGRLLEILSRIRHNEPAVALVHGAAGVGKSRLTYEFARLAKEQQTHVLIGSCRELSSGAAVPYDALTEALRQFVRREGLERAQQLAGELWPILDSLVSDSGEVALPTAAPQSQIRLFAAVLRLVTRLGQSAPQVLILEDIHWADASTLDLIRFIARATSNESLMLLCSFRPMASQHRLQGLLGDRDFRRSAHEIELEPFGRSELFDLATTLANRPIPSDRLDRYFELSEGNAYFAEQLVMADDPLTPEVEVPQSLREMMLTRLTRLSGDANDVACIAATAGRRTDDSLLAATSGLDDRDLERALLECIHQRVLTHDTSRDAYIFEHELLRDTAYQAMLPRARKRIHARIAEALSAEPRTGFRDLPELANHWFEAGRMPEAFSASIRAGAQAALLHAYPEAQLQYERALRLWADVPDPKSLADMPRERLLLHAAEAARWSNQVTRALDWVREAIASVDHEADPDRAGELQERLGHYLWQTGKYEGATAAYADADRLFADQVASAAASRVQSALATAAARQGDYEEALSRAERAAELARAVRARAEEGRALNSKGIALAFLDRIDEGEKELRAALQIAAEVDHMEDLYRAYGNLGVCLEQAGRSSDVVSVMQEGLARSKELGVLGSRQSALLANNAAVALSALGRYDEAAGLLDSISLNRPVAESLYARLTRAEIHVARGEFNHAELLLEQVKNRASIDPRFAGSLFACLAESAMWQGRRNQARSTVVRGLTVIRGTKNSRLVMQLCAIGLRIAADLGDTSGAETLSADVRRVAADPYGDDEVGVLTRQCNAELARASKRDTAAMWAEVVDGWKVLDWPFRKAYAMACLADAAVRAGAREQAATAAREALAIAEGLGAKPLWNQLEAFARERRLWIGKPRPYNLTPTELKVLRELVLGRTTPEIGAKLTISSHTVGVHIGNILRKLSVRNRAEAIKKARNDNF